MVLQRRVHPLIAALVVATVAASLVAAVDARGGGQLWRHLALIPSHVVHGELWRLATWPFVQRAPGTLIVTCVFLYVCGSDLVWRWGWQQLARHFITIVLAAGLGTTLVALVLPAWNHAHLGGIALADALLITWGLQFPDERVRVYFVLELSGRQLAYGAALVTALFAIFFGPGYYVPEMITCVVAFL